MGNLLWRLESVRSWLLSQKPVITRETVVSMSAKSQYVNEKSVQELNLRYTTIEKTIEDTCEAFLSSYPKGIKSGILDI
jgi:hypothetical protein